MVSGVEPLHLGRDPDGESRGVERLDEVDTAATRDGRIPRRLRIEPERGDGPKTGDGDATHRDSLRLDAGHGLDTIERPVERRD